MRKALALLFVCVTQFCFGTTAVTGNLRDPATNAVTTGIFLRLYLRGCEANQPRVNGTALIPPTGSGDYYVDFRPDSNGLITGTVYSTRDAAGTGNGQIQCGTSFTAVWYEIVPIKNGTQGTPTPVHAKNGVPLDITNATAITTNPVVTAPTGDSTYCRLDGGNCGFVGPVSFSSSAGITSAGSNSFTGSNTFNILSAKNLGTIRYADQFAGADWILQANAADTDCGVPACEVWINGSVLNAQTPASSSTPSIGQNHFWRFIQPGTFVSAKAFAVARGGGMGCLTPASHSIGTDQPPCLVQEAAGANLAAFINVNGPYAIFSNITFDGDKANNAGALDGMVFNNNAGHTVLDHVNVQNSKRNNFAMLPSSNTSCCSFAFSVVSMGAGNDGVFSQNTSDWFWSNIEVQNNANINFELKDSPGWRIEGPGEVSGALKGFSLYGTCAGGGTNNTQITNLSFGNQAQEDILMTGFDTVGLCNTVLGTVISGNKMVAGQSPGRSPNNTSSIIREIDGGQNTIVGNVCNSAIAPNQAKYCYEVTETAASRHLRSTFTGNSYNNNAGTGFYSDTTVQKSLISSNYEGSANSQIGPNIYLLNNDPLNWKNASGTVQGILNLIPSNDILIQNPNAGRIIYNQINGVNAWVENATASTNTMPANWALVWTEGTGAGNGAGVDSCYGDATLHALKCSFNNGSFLQIPQVITATSAAFATATTAGTCVQSTTAVTGATTAMTVQVSPVSTPGVGAVWSAFVSSAGNITINECAVAASAGGTIAFNIRVTP